MTISSSQRHYRLHQRQRSHCLKENSARLWALLQYTNTFSPKLANPGFIKRSRLIFDALGPKLIQDYSGWYIAIEPDSGDYFMDANKAVAQRKARQKYPERMFCTLKLIETGADRKV